MKERQSRYSWIPLWVDKWLYGSTRIELGPAERSVWIDLLVLASKDEGHIRANEITPYSDIQLAAMLLVPVEMLQSTIEKCINFGKLKLSEDKTLYVCNWEKFQLSRTYKYRFESGGNNDSGQDAPKKSRAERCKFDNNRPCYHDCAKCDYTKKRGKT